MQPINCNEQRKIIDDTLGAARVYIITACKELVGEELTEGELRARSLASTDLLRSESENCLSLVNTGCDQEQSAVFATQTGYIKDALNRARDVINDLSRSAKSKAHLLSQQYQDTLDQ